MSGEVLSLAVLVMAGVCTQEEADLVWRMLFGAAIPLTPSGAVKQIEHALDTVRKQALP